MTALETLTLRLAATLHDAMVTLDRNRAGIVLVVNDHGQLIGTVTDGDIRRAILGRMSPDATVDQIMCRRPLTAPADTSDADVVGLMHLHRIRHIPIVDENNRPMRLCQGSDLLTSSERGSAVAVIMAGGEGRRLRPLTDTVPKPLVQVGDATILDGLLSDVAIAGIRQVYVSVNYKADLIQEYVASRSDLSVTVSFLREETKMGTAGSLSLLPHTPCEPIVVINGDIVTTINLRQLLDYHSRHRSVFTVAAVEYLFRVPYGVLETVGHYVLGITEKPTKAFLCSAGIYVLDPEILRLARLRVPMDMTELMGAVVADGLPVCVFPVREKWIDVGNADDLYRARREFVVGV